MRARVWIASTIHAPHNLMMPSCLQDQQHMPFPTATLGPLQSYACSLERAVLNVSPVNSKDHFLELGVTSFNR